MVIISKDSVLQTDVHMREYNYLDRKLYGTSYTNNTKCYYLLDGEVYGYIRELFETYAMALCYENRFGQFSMPADSSNNITAQ